MLYGLGTLFNHYCPGIVDSKFLSTLVAGARFLPGDNGIGIWKMHHTARHC
jgi:hypothetical protein